MRGAVKTNPMAQSPLHWCKNIAHPGGKYAAAGRNGQFCAASDGIYQMSALELPQLHEQKQLNRCVRVQTKSGKPLSSCLGVSVDCWDDSAGSIRSQSQGENEESGQDGNRRVEQQKSQQSVYSCRPTCADCAGEIVQQSPVPRTHCRSLLYRAPAQYSDASQRKAVSSGHCLLSSLGRECIGGPGATVDTDGNARCVSEDCRIYRCSHPVPNGVVVQRKLVMSLSDMDLKKHASDQTLANPRPAHHAIRLRSGNGLRLYHPSADGNGKSGSNDGNGERMRSRSDKQKRNRENNRERNVETSDIANDNIASDNMASDSDNNSNSSDESDDRIYIG